MYHHIIQISDCYSRRGAKKTPLAKHDHCLTPEVLQLKEKKKHGKKERKRRYLLKDRSFGMKMCGKHNRQEKGLVAE